MSYKVEQLLEAQCHFNLLEDAKTEEAQFFENIRHERALQSLYDKEERFEMFNKEVKEEFGLSIGG